MSGRGREASAGAERLRVWALAPAWALTVALFLVPLGLVVWYSFHARGAYGGVTDSFTWENYGRLWDGLYGEILLRTLVLSGAATVACVAMAFPLALFIARSSARRKSLYLNLVMLPFWTSFLVRTYAWMFLLRETGLFNSVLLATGVIGQPLPLLYNNFAVFVGLVYGFLPFAVLPLYSNLERLDPALLEAAADLGATPWGAMRHVVWPLAWPGLRAAAILVFIPCLGTYLTSDLLGGGRAMLLGNLIQNQFTTARDWPFGSALSLALLVVVMGLLLYVLRRGQAESGQTESGQAAPGELL